MRRAASRLAALAFAGLVAQGCHAVPDVAGVVAGAGSGSASANPAVGIAVGIAVRAGVRKVVDYINLRRARGEQDAIAETAGAAPLGVARNWEIRHTIPIDNERGQVEAVREFVTPLATCREVLLTVVDDDAKTILATTLCREGDRWLWAAAEPAVPRWGYLQ